MEKATFDTRLSLDENFELVVSNAEAADPEMGKIFRSLTQLLVAASSDADRKTVRTSIHKLVKTDLDKTLSTEPK